MPDFSKAGKPERRFEVPKGWCEFLVEIPFGGCRAKAILNEWQVAYHACVEGPDTTAAIVQRGCALLKAGDTTFDGKKLKVSQKHFQSGFKRVNRYSNKDEWFDPTNKFFMGPAWQYMANHVYMGDGKLFEGVKMQTMLKLRLRPNSFTIGQSTTSTAMYHKDAEWNDRVEYYSDQFGSHVIESLLVRVKP